MIHSAICTHRDGFQVRRSCLSPTALPGGHPKSLTRESSMKIIIPPLDEVRCCHTQWRKGDTSIDSIIILEFDKQRSGGRDGIYIAGIGFHIRKAAGRLFDCFTQLWNNRSKGNRYILLTSHAHMSWLTWIPWVRNASLIHPFTSSLLPLYSRCKQRDWWALLHIESMLTVKRSKNDGTRN